MKIVGVDGCKAGWFAVWATLDPANGALTAADCAVATSFTAVFDAVPDAGVVAVDIPIGLPERIDGPGRVAEQAARLKLPGRTSSIFSMPARCAVYGSLSAAAPYERVRALARATSNPPKAVSKQGFNILDKVIEVDRFLRHHRDRIGRGAGEGRGVFESHPEVAFAVMGGAPCRTGKKTDAGAEERRQRLARTRAPLEIMERARTRHLKSRVADDDIIDALACLIVARRIALGQAISFPDPPGRDEQGLPIAIWA